jgi:hypothetical protein
MAVGDFRYLNDHDPDKKIVDLETWALIRGCLIEDLEIVPRRDWQAANPTRRERIMSRYDGIVLYGSGMKTWHNGNDPTLEARLLQKEHQAKGFSDVPHHFIVGLLGTVYQGRRYADFPNEIGSHYFAEYRAVKRLYIGEHLRRGNDGKIGVCLLGDYFGLNSSNMPDSVPKVQLNTLKNLMGMLCFDYDIDPENITTLNVVHNTVLLRTVHTIKQMVREDLGYPL